MNLIKQEKLQFQDEKSDKVYEIDLFQLQGDEYIVNFRYGRRGKNLKEGTKTVFPVPLETAEKLFADLVKGKTKKGYQQVANYSTIETAPSPTAPKVEQGARKTVLRYLNQMANGEHLTTNWKRSRIIWRAGELKLIEALPALAKLLPTLKDQEVYSAVWLLGKIANKESLELLTQLPLNPNSKWLHIQTAALVRCQHKPTIDNIVASLPVELRNLYTKGAIDLFFQQINEYLFKLGAKNIDFILSTYYLCIRDGRLKEPLLLTLGMISLEPGYWKYLRYIYKIAEMVEDGDTFGLLASRIQRNSHYFSSNYWGSAYIDGKSYNIDEELKKKDAKLAFSNKTKNYFIRRTINRLKQTGIDRQEAYCKLATGVLINYSESDKQHHYPTGSYQYHRPSDRYVYTKQVHPEIAHIPYLFYTLYAAGQRLKISGYGKFYFVERAKEQTTREDSFPMLWNEYPSYAVKLLVKGRMKEVVHFAFSILKGRTDLMDLFSIEDLKQLVLHPFPEVLEFSLDFIQRKYDPKKPDVSLINALINSKNEKAIEVAIALIDKNKKPFLVHPDFVKAALVSTNKALHIWVRTNIEESAFTKEQKGEIVKATLSHYQQLPEDELFEDSVNSLTHCFKAHLADLDMTYLLDLLENDRVQLQLLAAKLININNTPLAELPDGVLLKMIDSQHEEIRAQGMALLSKLTDDDLLKRSELVVELATNEHQDLRIKAQELIGRLAKTNSEFRDGVFLKLYPILLENQEDETLHQDIWSTISMHLAASIPLIEPEIDTVLKDNHRETHLLTAHYLDNHVDLNQWPVYRIAMMGNHDMKYIREMSWQYYKDQVDRIKYEKEEAIKILDTEWEETKDFGQSYFDQHFTEKDWNPTLIISLCDNVRPEVQSYGTKLLGQYFKEEHGIKYLKELSEHPAPVIQLYTTNYLDRYAFNNMEMLDQLELYFRTILGAINTKRAAKQRVFKFLDKQVEEGPEYGKYVASIINDTVGTIAVLDKQKCIQLLRKIDQLYDGIDSRIEVVPMEIRTK